MNAWRLAVLTVEGWGTAAGLAFALLYHWLSGGRWGRTPVGRHLMALALVDAVVFGMLLGGYLVSPGATWYAWLYLVAVAGIPATTSWRIVILVRLNRARGGVE